MTGTSDLWYRSVQMRAGQTFGSLVRAESAMLYDKVLYVDFERGAEGNSGATLKKAVKTINGAMNRIYARDWDLAKGRHYAVVLQGRTTTGMAQTEMQLIDLPGVHLIGAGRWFGHGGGASSCLVMGSSSGYEKPTALWVDDNGCSVEGIKFYMPSEFALGSEESCIYTKNPVDVAIVDNQFIGANANGDITGKYSNGILIEGAEGPYIAGNEFMYCYRGIKAGAGTSRYFHKAKIHDNVFFSPGKGIYFYDTYALENDIARNRILRKSAGSVGYGHTLTGGIDLSGNSSGNFITDNRVGHGTATTAYVKGSGTNYWCENYVGSGSGGALYAET